MVYLDILRTLFSSFFSMFEKLLRTRTLFIISCVWLHSCKEFTDVHKETCQIFPKCGYRNNKQNRDQVLADREEKERKHGGSVQSLIPIFKTNFWRRIMRLFAAKVVLLFYVCLQLLPTFLAHLLKMQISYLLLYCCSSVPLPTFSGY